MPESAKEKLRQIAIQEFDERSIRSKNNWKNKDYREKFSKGAKQAVLDVKNFTEEQFYEWIKDKKVFTNNGKTGDIRPNSRVKLVIDHFDKTEEFYGNYYKEREQKIKKTWEYYKECSDEEFRLWVADKDLFRSDGNRNPRVSSVIRHRGLEKEFY
jgi:hypothetical protein